MWLLQALKIYSDAYWRFVSTLVKNHWDSYCPDTLRDLVDCLRYESDKACRKLLEKKAMAQVGRPGAERRSNGDVSNMDAANGLDKNANNLSNAQVESHAEELEMKIATATGDVFGAGYDTLHTAVTWMFLYMAAYPEMQQKASRLDCWASVTPKCTLFPKCRWSTIVAFLSQKTINHPNRVVSRCVFSIDADVSVKELIVKVISVRALKAVYISDFSTVCGRPTWSLLR